MHSTHTAPSFYLQKLWLYVHPAVHTLFLIYQLILELAIADNHGAVRSSSSSSSTEGTEEAVKKKTSLKAFLSKVKQDDTNGSGGSRIPL